MATLETVVHLTPEAADFFSDNLCLPCDNHIHPRPLFGSINSIQEIRNTLNQQADRINNPEPPQRATIQSIKVVNEQLPKRDPKTRQRLEFNDLESGLFEKILQSIFAKAVKIPWLFMQMPNEGNALDCNTTGF